MNSSDGYRCALCSHSYVEVVRVMDELREALGTCVTWCTTGPAAGVISMQSVLTCASVLWSIT